MGKRSISCFPVHIVADVRDGGSSRDLLKLRTGTVAPRENGLRFQFPQFWLKLREEGLRIAPICNCGCFP